MPDTTSSNNTLFLLAGLGIGAYLLLRGNGSAASANQPTSASVATFTASGTSAAAGSTTATAPAAPTVYPMDGEPDIVFALASDRDNANGPNQPFDTQWGDGSRQVRVDTYRALGSNFHIYVEDIQALFNFRMNQVGGSWDDMYNSFKNNPGSMMDVINGYNQQNPGRPIAQRW